MATPPQTPARHRLTDHDRAKAKLVKAEEEVTDLEAQLDRARGRVTSLEARLERATKRRDHAKADPDLADETPATQAPDGMPGAAILGAATAVGAASTLPEQTAMPGDALPPLPDDAYPEGAQPLSGEDPPLDDDGDEGDPGPLAYGAAQPGDSITDDEDGRIPPLLAADDWSYPGPEGTVPVRDNPQA